MSAPCYSVPRFSASLNAPERRPESVFKQLEPQRAPDTEQTFDEFEAWQATVAAARGSQ